MFITCHWYHRTVSITYQSPILKDYFHNLSMTVFSVPIYVQSLMFGSAPRIKKSKIQNLDFLIIDFTCFRWTKNKLVLIYFFPSGGYQNSKFSQFKFFPKSGPKVLSMSLLIYWFLPIEIWPESLVQVSPSPPFRQKE